MMMKRKTMTTGSKTKMGNLERTNRMMTTTMAMMTMTMMTTSTRTKMGGLEGTNRLGGRAEQPITPLHTSNPKPTLHSRCPHATSVTLHFSVQSESSRHMRSYRGGVIKTNSPVGYITVETVHDIYVQ